MKDTIERSEANIIGLYHKLRRSFVDITLPSKMQLANLGSSPWRRSSGKERYLKLMLAVTRERTTDIVTPFANDLYSGVGQMVKVLKDNFVPYYYDDVKPALLKKLYQPKSIYTKALHAASLSNYYDYLEPRDFDLVVPDKVIKLYEQHRATYVRNWDAVDKLEPDEIVTGLEPNVNIGSDLWISQNKKNFEKHFRDFGSRWLGTEYDLTLSGIVSMIDDLSKKDIYPPITAFYRGKDANSVRGVFGGSVPLKAMGAVMQLLKRDVSYPGIHANSLVPWGPWEDWSLYFPKAAEMVSKARDHDANVIGEDFITFDTHVRPDDLEQIVLPIHDKLSVFYNYVLKTLRHNVVFWGPYMLRNIYYVSGHPFTSEIGSILHYAISAAYEAEHDCALLDGSCQSDDNLFVWTDFNFDDYAVWCKARGYPIKDKGSSNFNELGYVRFLQNDIGPIKESRDDIIFVGALDSRYPRMIHLETGGETMVWSITEDLETDRFLSKNASFSEEGKEYVEAIFGLVRDNIFGRKAIRAVADMDELEKHIVALRRDLVGFHPSWLKKVVLPDLRLHDI